MKQYLNMADVFPVEIRTDDESGSLICDEDGVILESFSGDKVADYALHAINSHDELVQMNQDLLAALEAVSNCGRGSSGRIILDDLDEQCLKNAIAKVKGGAE